MQQYDLSDVRSIKADSFRVALDKTQVALEKEAPVQVPVRPLEKTLDIGGFIYEAEGATEGEDGKVSNMPNVCTCVAQSSTGYRYDWSDYSLTDTTWHFLMLEHSGQRSMLMLPWLSRPRRTL